MANNHKLPSIVANVFQMLNSKKIEYAVLRNYEGLPNLNKSRDIDIVIHRRNYSVIKRTIVDCIQKEEYSLVTFFESERLNTFVCGKVIDKEVELVQFDFFTHTSAYGHIILTDDELLASRIKTNGVYHVSKEFEFLDKYLYLKYIGAKYPDKYVTLKQQMLRGEKLPELLHQLFKIDSLHELEKMSIKEFRKKNKQMGKESFGNILLFWWYYIKNNLTYRGYSIGFTGPDGSGKTTVIEMLQTKLSAVYSKINLYHFRPSLFGNLGEMAYSAGLKKEVDRDYNKPHRGEKVGMLSSFFRLVYYSIDYIFGFIKRVRPSLSRRELIIFDRYYTDIVCDSRRSRIYLNPKFLYWFGKLFIPSLDYNILLTADTETILQRKRELDSKGIEAINAKINYLANKKGYYRILNDGTPQEAVVKILRIVFEEQHKKNVKKLN